MSSIPREALDAFEEALYMQLQNTGIKTVKFNARLFCPKCHEAYLTLSQYKAQVNDISEHHWICPKCNSSCQLDIEYTSRLLGQ